MRRARAAPQPNVPDAGDIVERRRRRYKMRMILAPLVIVLLIAAVASGCGGTDPFVFRKNEFDRNDANFNKPLADREDVTICYNGMGTSDRQVASLAEEECRRFGKLAEAAGESFGECPLLVPVAARYLCTSPPSSPAPAEPSAPTPDLPTD